MILFKTLIKVESSWVAGLDFCVIILVDIIELATTNR
jgi:hypothetical protein